MTGKRFFFYILGNLENIIQIRAKEFEYVVLVENGMIFKISQQGDLKLAIINIINPFSTLSRKL